MPLTAPAVQLCHLDLGKLSAASSICRRELMENAPDTTRLLQDICQS